MGPLDLKLGPLRYRFLPRDDSARTLLEPFPARLDSRPPGGRPGRLINVMRADLGRHDLETLASGRLPPLLRALLPEGAPVDGWNVFGDQRGFMEARFPGLLESFWLFGRGHDVVAPGFWIPWGMILRDIAGMGGAVAHGALAVRGGEGGIFCAAAGGGKTTAMANLAGPWQVKSDDATLIWPVGEGAWLGSPLPTWGAMHGTPVPAGLPCRWESGRAVRVEDLYFIRKAEKTSCRRLDALETARLFVLTLREHPATVSAGAGLEVSLFRVACRAARELRGWALDLPEGECPGAVIAPGVAG